MVIWNCLQMTIDLGINLQGIHNISSISTSGFHTELLWHKELPFLSGHGTFGILRESVLHCPHLSQFVTHSYVFTSFL